MPDNSTIEQQLAWAKPISDGGSATGITILRRKKTCIISAGEWSVNMRETDTKVNEEGGGGAAGVEGIPCSPW